MTYRATRARRIGARRRKAPPEPNTRAEAPEPAFSPTATSCCGVCARAGRELTKVTKEVGASAVKEVSKAAEAASGLLSSEVRGGALLAFTGSARAAEKPRPPWWRGSLARETGGGGAKDASRRPIGISLDLGGLLGANRPSLYSAPAAGKKRKPGYRGDPVLPVSPSPFVRRARA